MRAKFLGMDAPHIERTRPMLPYTPSEDRTILEFVCGHHRLVDSLQIDGFIRAKALPVCDKAGCDGAPKAEASPTSHYWVDGQGRRYERVTLTPEAGGATVDHWVPVSTPGFVVYDPNTETVAQAQKRAEAWMDRLSRGRP